MRRPAARFAPPLAPHLAPHLALVVLLGGAAPAVAGQTACWFEHGAVVAPASIAGLSGDYVIDLSAPRTLLHNTKAQAAGYDDTALTVPVRLAGQTVAALAVAVVDLDARGGPFDTPIAGVIGADVLGRYVVDIRFAPCRLTLSRPGSEPAFGRGASLPATLVGGVPTVTAAVADGAKAWSGPFAIDTASTAAARLPGLEARLVPPGTKLDPQARHLAPARLRALSLGGILFESVGATLADDLPAGLAVILYLLLFTGLLYASYRKVWKNESH
ncbi:MAG: hypothetical protein JWP92_2614 [Caulobacter sp.]|nr:hypothetical protein [Caulobacter sp.]